MKVEYISGTPEEIRTVEVVGMKISRIKGVFNKPLIQQVRIKYEDGTTEWIDGMKFYTDTQDSESLEHYKY